mgnify:CR=1 FL=1|jgi:hypothetical protein
MTATRTLSEKDSAANLIVAAIDNLRAVAEFYDGFSEEEQKYIRHNIYQRRGKFAKAVKEEVLVGFPQIQQELDANE